MGRLHFSENTSEMVASQEKEEVQSVVQSFQAKFQFQYGALC